LARKPKLVAPPEVAQDVWAGELSRQGAMFKQLQLRIFRTNNRIQRVGDALMKDLGLTVSRWLVLDYIAKGPKSVAQIARNYDQTRQGFLWVVEAMAKLGQVDLLPDPNDRRAKLVRCTPKGHDLYEQAKKLQNAWIEQVAGEFSAAELMHIAEFIDEIGDAVLIAGSET
jgi:DNA-binding MarR family transcriptional regulator